MSDLFETVRTRRTVVVNAKGLHARAAAKLAKLAGTYKSDMMILRPGAADETAVSARSIMGLMMLAAAKGAEIEITARGPDAAEALAAAVALVEDGFGER